MKSHVVNAGRPSPVLGRTPRPIHRGKGIPASVAVNCCLLCADAMLAPGDAGIGVGARFKGHDEYVVTFKKPGSCPLLLEIVDLVTGLLLHLTS